MRPLARSSLDSLAIDSGGASRSCSTSFLFAHGIAHGVFSEYTTLLIFRALYGIGMGGEWGLGASLAMETLPTEARGLFSGICSRVHVWYLFAALVYGLVFPFFGWRALFLVGALPALLVIYIRARVPESPVWLRQRSTVNFWASLGDILKRHWLLFLYVVLLMTVFNAMSHGTQDMYQPFWASSVAQRERKSIIGIIYAVGAICGGILVAIFAKVRRRRLIIITVICSIILSCVGFSPGLSMLVAGGS